MDAVERLFFELIKGFKKTDLEEAIKNKVSLIKEANAYAPYLLQLSKELYPFYTSQAGSINYKTILDWLKHSRPDMFQVITASREGQNWLKKQINDIKKYV